MLTDTQRGVLRGIAAGLVISIVGLVAVVLLAPPLLLPHAAFPATLAAAFAWDALIVVCLALNIGALARHRFFTPQDIDGGGLSQGSGSAQVLQATLQNTLEQVVLALAVHGIWAAVMPLAWQAAVPLAALLFVIGRILFWRGYAAGAPARALGFALTFYPSALMLIAILGFLVVRQVG